MMELLRSFFGLGSAAKRTVLGSNPSVDLKDVGHIKESNNRLNALQHLCVRYKDTLHAVKINAVYEKTKNVHNYLVSKQRFHELELFHVQHTNHFINTFGLIIDVYQRNEEITRAYAKIDSPTNTGAEPVLHSFNPGRIGPNGGPYNHPEKEKSLPKPQTFVYTEEAGDDVPKLIVPAILINTYGKILYLKEDNSDGLVANEIGFTSTEKEKETFLFNVSVRLGIKNITYVGNAMVNIPNNTGFNPTAMVPVIHWQGAMYALNLHDYRLFPVRIQRKRS